MNKLEKLQQINDDLRAHVEQFRKGVVTNKYLLKNVSLTLQKKHKTKEDLQEIFKTADEQLEKHHFQSMLERDPFNLKTTDADKLASLFFFENKKAPVNCPANFRNRGLLPCSRNSFLSTITILREKSIMH
jgi:hypothetical protein